MRETSDKVKALTKRRLDLNLSQRDLDKLVDVSACQIAKWEKGFRHPTLESAERWAQALGLKLELTLTGKKRKKAP
jgi:transcriptional regulator with XRE-family HTH domain